MYCKSCGKQIDNDSTFCSYCGTKQSVDLKPQVQTDVNQSTQQYIDTSQRVYKSETNIKTSPNIVRQPKYDPTYKKEDDALTFGIILLVIASIFVIAGPIKFEDKESYGQFRALTAIASIIIRIIVTVWVVNIAKRQNRETFWWGFFAFLLPSIALIIIATRKKLFASVHIIEGLDNEQNSKILSDKAQEYFNDSKYSESIRFAESAIVLNSNNETAKGILQKSNIAIADINKGSFSDINIVSNNSTQTILRETTDDKLLKIVSKFNQTIGADVFIDDLPAPNGIYNYKLGTHKLIIENGKIKERYFIERVRNILIEKTNEHFAQKGDKVFLDTGIPAPTGKYNMGFMASKLVVEDGKFVNYE